MGLYLNCRLPAEYLCARFPQQLEFQTQDKKRHEVCYYEADSSLGEGGLMIRLKNIFLIEEDGREVEENAKIEEIFTRFQGFTRLVWLMAEESGGEDAQDAVQGEILRAVLDLTKPMVLLEEDLEKRKEEKPQVSFFY